ncbi:MAG: AAA family ATPase [Planctomycetes bacterium]|nr:AAA family ATPase [Planctomycetota bacterium]
MQLTEKYRPQRLSQIVGQDKAVATIRRLIGRKGWDRDALWIEGPTGTGKTAMARAVANELGCDQWTVEEIDGQKCSVDCVRNIGNSIGLGGWGGGLWRVWIVNEAQAMTARAVQAWLTLLEKVPANRLIIFTTTEDITKLFGEFSEPFSGRLKIISLTKIGLREKFARLAQRIAIREGLDGKGFKGYLRLLHVCHNSMRAALNRIEAGEMLAVEHDEATEKLIAAGRRANSARAAANAAS